VALRRELQWLELSPVLPNFVVIGAQKSGTTSLWAYLQGHPEVYLSETKEPNFFTSDADAARRDWYEQLFEGSTAKAVGEASTTYTMYPLATGVPARMAAMVPGARLVYVMRHPVERMRSAYRHRLARGSDHRPIERALAEDSTYLDVSRYAMQLEQYLAHFPRSQLLLITAEDLRDHRAATLARVCSFIDVNPAWRPTAAALEAEHNASAGLRRPRTAPRLLGGALIRSHVVKPGGDRRPRWMDHSAMSKAISDADTSPSPSLRLHLEQQLRPDVERLVPLMDQGFDGWGLL